MTRIAILAEGAFDRLHAKTAIETVARQTGLPATDAVRYGADVIGEAVVAR